MKLSIIKKSPTGVLVTDVIRGLKQQGISDEDLIAGMTKAKIPDDMARSIVSRVTEELEIDGIRTQKSVTRTEIDSSLFEWGRDFEMKINEKLDDFSDVLLGLRVDLKKGRMDQELCLKEIEVIKGNIRDLTSSVKSFEIYAKEILKALK